MYGRCRMGRTSRVQRNSILTAMFLFTLSMMTRVSVSFDYMMVVVVMMMMLRTRTRVLVNLTSFSWCYAELFLSQRILNFVTTGFSSEYAKKYLWYYCIQNMQRNFDNIFLFRICKEISIIFFCSEYAKKCLRWLTSSNNLAGKSSILVRTRQFDTFERRTVLAFLIFLNVRPFLPFWHFWMHHLSCLFDVASHCNGIRRAVSR